MKPILTLQDPAINGAPPAFAQQGNSYVRPHCVYRLVKVFGLRASGLLGRGRNQTA